MTHRHLMLSLAALLAGCASSGTPIVASEGGSITSDDGILTLVFPPGALPQDVSVSIRALPESGWPVDAPGRFERVGEVYQVRPAGLQLAEDAYAVVIPPDPSALVAPDGGDLFMVHYTWTPTDEKVRPAPVSRTWRLADGRVAVVGTLFEIGTHWVGDRVPGAERSLPALSAHVSPLADSYPVGESFALESLDLVSDLDHTLFERAVTGAVVSTGDGAVTPMERSGWSARTWDATIDSDLGMHPLEWFGDGSARSESLVRFSTPEPASMTAEEPVSPVTPELPEWTCDSASSETGSLWVGVDVITGASAGVVTVGSVRELGTTRCE